MKKTLHTRLTELIFGLKKKISYTYLKINNFLYLPEKLVSYTCAKKLEYLILDVFWILENISHFSFVKLFNSFAFHNIFSILK